jgi:hypothetical protein
MMWVVLGLLVVIAVVLGIIGIRIKTSRNG